MKSPDPAQSIEWAIKNHGLAVPELERMLCRASFYDFVRLAWGQIDPDRFIDNWHIRAICNHLQALVEGRLDHRKVMINVPPGSSKSLICSVMFPAWCWIDRPWLRFQCTAYREALTIRDSRRCRELIASDWYQSLFGGSFKIKAGDDALHRFGNDQKGYRLAVPTAGIMGDGGDFCLLDDPHNVMQAESDTVRDEMVRLIRLALPTRVRNWRRGGAIVIMQRLHSKDYCGVCLKNERDWEHLCFPARFEVNHPFPVRSSLGFVDPRTKDGELLNPLLMPADRLDKLITDMGGSYGAMSQMQQRPGPREGGMFKKKWWKYCDASDVPDDADRARGWDFGASEESTADYTASVKMARSDGKVYVEHAEHFRASPGQVEQRFVKRCEADGQSVDVSIPEDPGQAGRYQVQHMLSLVHGYNATGSSESGSKQERAKAMAGQAEFGNVIIVRGSWNETFTDEHEAFPGGEHDDLVDAGSRAYHHVADYRGRAGVW